MKKFSFKSAFMLNLLITIFFISVATYTEMIILWAMSIIFASILPMCDIEK